MLPYFRRSSASRAATSQYRGAHGELRSRTLRNDHPTCRAWVEAAQQFGLPRNADFNGATTYGVGAYQLEHRQRWRASAAVAFLRPAHGAPEPHGR